jgi:predicted nucleic acid-binding Zn ribbon protein
MTARKRMNKPVPLERILSRALELANIDINPDLCKLWTRWPDLVGPTIAKNAKPAVIKKRMLIVHVTSTPWIQELQYLKDDIIEKLNTELGENRIQDVRFKIGPIE